MKTEAEVRAKIKEVKGVFKHVLIGSLATIHVNAPRALEQINADSRLRTLYWVLGKKYKSKLKGVNT